MEDLFFLLSNYSELKSGCGYHTRGMKQIRDLGKSIPRFSAIPPKVTLDWVEGGGFLTNLSTSRLVYVIVLVH
jgi:hypothetical protein